MIFRSVRQVVLVAVAAFICWELSRRFGRWPAVGVWAVVMAIGCIGSALLLRSAPMGQIAWRNRPAGYFLPWGYTLGRGQLPGIVATSWAVWTLVAIAVCILWTSPATTASATTLPTTGPASPATVRPWIVPLLFAAWALNGAVILYLLNTLVKNFTPGSRGQQTLHKILAVVIGILVVSVALWLYGNPGMALSIAGGPYLLIGGTYGLFLAVVLFSGSKGRWN